MNVYVGRDVEVSIIDDDSGDMGAFVAQEVTLEPKQAIEGIDGLGDDEVQLWAPGLKTFEGSLKEPLMHGEDGEIQMNRLAAFQDPLEEYTMVLTYADDSGDMAITLTGVIFPEGSVASPKNAPSYITTKFKAKTAVAAIPEA